VTASPDGPDDPQPRPRRVRVPIGRRDMFGEFDEEIVVDEDVAAQWSSRVWHDGPAR